MRGEGAQGVTKRRSEEPREGQTERNIGGGRQLIAAERRAEGKEEKAAEVRKMSEMDNGKRTTERQRKMRVSNKGRRIHYHAGQRQPNRVTEV